jgi:hypothetical protein
MCLETLADIKEIGSYRVCHVEDFLDTTVEDFDAPIIINHGTNTIAFTLQKGPIKEVGANGVQIDTLILTCKQIIEGLNKKFSCYENVLAMEGLKDSLTALEKRKQNREERGVEGTSGL